MRLSLIKNITIVLTMCALLASAALLIKRANTPAHITNTTTATMISCDQPGDLLVQTLTQGPDEHHALSARLETMLALTGERPQRWHISHDQRTELAHLNPSTLPGGLELTELACDQGQYSLRVARRGQQTPMWLTLSAKSPALIWVDAKTVIALEVRGPQEGQPVAAQGRWLLHQALAVALSNLNIN